MKTVGYFYISGFIVWLKNRTRLHTAKPLTCLKRFYMVLFEDFSLHKLKSMLSTLHQQISSKMQNLEKKYILILKIMRLPFWNVLFYYSQKVNRNSYCLLYIKNNQFYCCQFDSIKSSRVTSVLILKQLNRPISYTNLTFIVFVSIYIHNRKSFQNFVQP